MKILFAVHGYKPAWRIGGPVISVSSLAESLVKRGHDVTVFTTDSNLDRTLDVPTDRTVDVEGVKVRYFRRRSLIPVQFPRVEYLSKSVGFLYAPALKPALDELVPSVDLVHTHLPFVYPTYAAAHAAFRYGKPLFYHQRGVFDPERLKFRSLKKTLYLQLVEVPILRRAEMLIALTDAERTSYTRLGITTPIRVIPNGIDAHPYSHPPDPGDLAPLGIRPEHRLVLFMGRLHPIKGADRLLAAFVRIAQRHPDAVLVLAGPDEFGIEQTFRAGAEAAGLDERVVFPGMVSGPIKHSLLARADLFCLPSDAEGFSMAVLEALASRTAVLLTPGCHFPEVERSGAGRIVANDVPALATALDELLAAPATLAAMGTRGQRLVAERFTWQRITDAVAEAYAEGIARHSHGRLATP